jgi:hypothetical protein
MGKKKNTQVGFITINVTPTGVLAGAFELTTSARHRGEVVQVVPAN